MTIHHHLSLTHFLSYCFLRSSISPSLLFINQIVLDYSFPVQIFDCEMIVTISCFMNLEVYIRRPYHRLGEKGGRVKYCQYRLRLISRDSKTLYGGQLFSVMCSCWEDLESRWWRNSSFSCALLITRQRLAWFELFAHPPLAFLIRPVRVSSLSFAFFLLSLFQRSTSENSSNELRTTEFRVNEYWTKRKIETRKNLDENGGERRPHALRARRVSNILEKVSSSSFGRGWSKRRRTSRKNIGKRFRGRQARRVARDEPYCGR